MSLALEPATTAKVVLHTTKGPIELELWAKQVPLACRNFIQLCLEGYYDGVQFHRIVKDFIVQSGDPTGTGHGGDAIYPEGRFENEFHSRLKFNRRGLLGCASMVIDEHANGSSGGSTNSRRLKKSDKVNGSQFFITLAATPELTHKSTLFGKVVGDTIFNVTQISQGETDNNDRPIYPATITRVEVVTSYFEGIVPRAKKVLLPPSRNANLSKNFKRKKIKLSFDDNDESDDEEPRTGFKPIFAKNKIKLPSDVVDSGVLKDSRQTIQTKIPVKETSRPQYEPTVPKESLESLLGKSKQERPESERLKDEFEKLKSSMKRDFDGRLEPQDMETKPEMELAVAQERERYTQNMDRLLSTANKKEERELQTLELLNKFKSKLSSSALNNSKQIAMKELYPELPKKKIIKLSDFNSDDELPSDYNSDDYEIQSDNDEDVTGKSTKAFLSHKFELDPTSSHLENEDTLITIDTRD
ncbi:cyclophilin-like protein [Nadsonia fulvescens var. elongata DSM 6958]|uniref:Cyclophilin-like protein n=1 Tax=Nadsonia fulvescens var. elongata DSM 6958 TaxID=857566 RepID=A0A1E3PNL4_9ASCO|nr:cyclophilin-like protein [Nadsonia fulvescens var. elongata DSM 6958]